MALLPRRIALAALLTVGIAGLQPVLAATAATSSVPVPVLTGPANNTTTPLKSVVLTWDSVPGASQYQVQVSPNAEWTNNTVTLPNSGDTVNDLYEMPLSLPHADYYWHVRAKVGGVWGSYSAADQFQREWYVPITVLQSPASNGDPSLSWAPVADASEYLVRFSLSSSFAPAQTVTCYTNNTSFTPYLLTSAKAESATGSCFDIGKLTIGKTYYWELEALDDTSASAIAADTDNDSAWDCPLAQPECDAARTIGQFTFAAPTTDPTNPPTDDPVTGLKTSWHTTSTSGTACNTSSACPMTPTFSWDPVSEANYYLVHVWHDVDGSNTYRSYETAWPELTPRDSYFDAQAGSSYYWDVTAATCISSDTNPTCAMTNTSSTPTCAAGSDPGTSDPTLLSTNSGVSASPHGQEGAQSVIGGTPSTVTLTGTNLEDGLCVAPTDGTVTNVDVVSPTMVTFTYHASTLAETVTFSVVNPDGAASGDSAPLTVDGTEKITLYGVSALDSFNKASGAVATTTPTDDATVHGGDLTFKWDDFMATGGDGGYDARNYELQVSKDPTFDTDALDVSDIDLTQYTDPAGPLANGTYYWRVAAIDESGNVLTWSDTKTVTLEVTKPTIQFVADSNVAIAGPITIKLSEALSGVSTSSVLVKSVDTKATVAGKLTAGSTAETYEFTPTKPLIIGETYSLAVTSALTDSFGNPVVVTGGTVRATRAAKDTSKAWTYSGGWKRHSASGALSGSYESASKGHTASISLVGGTATLYACTGPTMGTVEVTVNGHTTKVSEHKSFTRCGEAVWSGAIGKGVQKLSVKTFKGTGNLDEVKVS